MSSEGLEETEGATVSAPPVSATALEPAMPQKKNRRALFLAAWLASALAVGAGSGFGILAGTDLGSKKAATTPVATASASPKPASGVRADGTHYGTLKDFLLPMPADFQPGPDEGELGSDATVSPTQLDSQVSLLFGTLPPSDMSSAKGVMEGAHMTDGAVRTYARSKGDLDVSIAALQLDPSMAAKSTGDFIRIVQRSSRYRSGPAVPGYPDAVCVLPATKPGDKLDQMTCLATVGDTFVVVLASGVVPMDQKGVTAMFAQQLDLFKNGPAK